MVRATTGMTRIAASIAVHAVLVGLVALAVMCRTDDRPPASHAVRIELVANLPAPAEPVVEPLQEFFSLIFTMINKAVMKVIQIKTNLKKHLECMYMMN